MNQLPAPKSNTVQSALTAANTKAISAPNAISNPNVIIHKPQPGFQEQLLRTDKVNFVIAGSGAGVGKTYIELFDALRHTDKHRYYAVLFRKTYQQIFSSIIPQALDLYSGVKYNKFLKSPHPNFTFYDDAKLKKPRSLIQFSQLLYDNDVYNWQGAELSRVYYDEITQFSKKQVMYLLSRLRSQTTVTPRLLGTCNPDPDSFILDILDAGGYIMADGFADPDMAGKVLWMVHKEDEYIFGKDRADLAKKTGIDEPMSFTFIPGSIYDNKIMLDKNPQYLSMLQGLPEYERAILLHGNWRAKLEGNIFKRHLFHDYYEDDLFNPISITHKAIFVDTAQTQNSSSDYTVFLCAGVTNTGKLVILDMIREKLGPMETFRLAEAFYRKHDVREYSITDGKTGQVHIVRSSRMQGLFAEWANRGIDILQHLKKDKGLNVGPIKRGNTIGKIQKSDFGNRGNDKISRAISVLPMLEKSGIWLPATNTRWTGYDSWAIGLNSGVLQGAESVCTEPRKWVSELKNELLGFKQGDGTDKKAIAAAHDDITDCVVDAATFLLDSRGLGWLQGMLNMGM